METSHRFRNSRQLSLAATLHVPEHPAAKTPIVVFAHGWASSKVSPRNVEIAEALLEAGMAVLLFDFTGHGASEGDADATGLLEQTDDLSAALDFVSARPELGPIGLAGSSSGGAVALAVAARDPRVRALVLRAPSSDASFADAERTRVPTLVIQGEADSLLARNRELVRRLGGDRELHVVARASHLFAEAGTFREARSATVRWFGRWLQESRPNGGQVKPGARSARQESAPPSHFIDRADAGRSLAQQLLQYKGPATLVLALPRGGISVAEPIARALGAELDVFVSRKVRAPAQPELAIGAVAEGDVVVWNEDVLAELGVDQAAQTRELERSRRELAERLAKYRAVRPRAKLAGRTVIVVDDGVATGATLRAALVALGKLGVTQLVVALPGGASDTLDAIARMPEVDKLVALARPEPFFAVGQLYDRFEPVSSAEVCDALRGEPV
jgi:predicted phosphoribosyltransferase/alpha-beta hydrolase superfamily lysophospholipase